ncbi:MAG: transposase, partial [Streptosporangiales bacterium]
RAAREELIDACATDAHACLAVLDGRDLDTGVEQAGRLLATVAGQDLDQDTDGVFRIARRVAADRVISTVDPQARHGHKTSARGFDGYKGHAAVDPDSEIVTATTVTAGNAADTSVAEELIADLLDHEAEGEEIAADQPAEHGQARSDEDREDAAVVYGDNAYGTGAFHDLLHNAGIESRCKTQQPVAAGGLFAKDRFAIDLHQDTVTCPAGQVTSIRRGTAGGGMAYFGAACTTCPLRAQCTTAAGGRTVSVGPYEQALADARARQVDPAWQGDYRATRPKVERKLAHLMRRRHGGRRARMRGQTKIDADFRLLAAAANLARLAALGVRSTRTGWAAATP